MTCLDTDFIVSVLREDKNALRKMEELERRQEAMSVTSITAAELLKGAYNSKEPERELTRVKAYLDSLDILDFDIKCAIFFGKIWFDLKSKGEMINEFDILVASVVINNNEILLTKNVKHFEKIRELKLETW